MKNLLMGMMLLCSVTAFADNEKGNGGGIHHCPDRSAGQQFEFYDLYEGKNARPERPIPVYLKAYGTADKMIEDAIKKLADVNPVFAELVEIQLEYIALAGSVKRVNKKLKLVPDANYLWVDEDCSYQQLANWREKDNRLYVRESFMAQMEKSPLDLAAFKMHETIYKAARLVQEQTSSDKVRELVAYLFSPASIPADVMTFIDSINFLQDLNLGNRLEVINLNDNSVQIHLGKINKEKMNQQLRITLSLPEVEQARVKDDEICRLLETKLKRKEKRSLIKEQRNLGYLIAVLSVPKGKIDKETSEIVMDYDLMSVEDLKELTDFDLDLQTWIIFGQLKGERRNMLMKVELLHEGHVTEEASTNLSIKFGVRGFYNDKLVIKDATHPMKIPISIR